MILYYNSVVTAANSEPRMANSENASPGRTSASSLGAAGHSFFTGIATGGFGSLADEFGL